MNMRSLIPWGRNSDVPATRFDEGSPFLSLHRQMNRLFDDFFRDFDMPLATRTAWQSWPHVEIEEGDREYRLVAELPGMDEKDIDVSLREGVLILKGEKRAETSGSPNGARYSERWFGKFERSFHLGPDVDPDKVNAAFKKGVLTISVGKRADAPSRVKRITISREG